MLIAARAKATTPATPIKRTAIGALCRTGEKAAAWVTMTNVAGAAQAASAVSPTAG